jgi:KTSC domain
MVEMREVFSSNVDRIGYDQATGTLQVEFKSGKTAVYRGVPAGVANQVVGAPSVGSALHELVRGKFPHAYDEL